VLLQNIVARVMYCSIYGDATLSFLFRYNLTSQQSCVTCYCC